MMYDDEGSARDDEPPRKWGEAYGPADDGAPYGRDSLGLAYSSRLSAEIWRAARTVGDALVILMAVGTMVVIGVVVLGLLALLVLKLLGVEPPPIDGLTCAGRRC